MNNKFKIGLLLTACIEPTQFKDKVHRNDTLIRLEDYKTALKLWLHHNDDSITSIIFAENSGYDLTEIETVFIKENIYNRKYQIIQAIASKVPEGLHYGYSELELIDNILDKITLLNDNDFIIKTTGRVYFPKISSLLVKTVPSYNFITDSRNFNLGKWKQNYVLSNLFIFNILWYKENLFDKKRLMLTFEVTHFETLLHKLLVGNKVDKDVLLRFPMNVNPIGFGAHWNINYQSLDKRLGYLLRAIFRKMLPNFWI
jgi:hypothetical protein